MGLLLLLLFICVRILDTCCCAHVHMYDWEIENSSLFPRCKLRSLMMHQKLIIASSEFRKNTGMGRHRHSDPQLAYYCFTFCSVTN